MTKLTALFLTSLTTVVLSTEPIPFTINTKKWSHVLDDHFISITVNPTDLLQGKVYGLAMNSTMAILKGLAPAYVRIGSADTGKYTFKRNRYPSDVVKPDDEYTVTETHWMVFNEVAKQAGLDVIVCLNAAHRSEGTTKWDTRNSLELISFSDSQGYNLTWQLGYEVQGGDSLSGLQFGKDLNRLRTILNAFPRYQHAKLIGPDIRVIHKKEEIDFWNDVLVEAGPTLDAVTWHPRWPQPSKMKVSDNSDLGYEFPIDYLEWDRAQLSKILQKSIFKNPVWIGETKRESTGTFAEGLIWARRLVLAAKSGIEVVMKQPNLMDVTHPKPEYWIALLHKRLLGKSVLETRSVGNMTDLSVISHCTNPFYWSDKPEKLQDGAVTVYGVNMGGLEQKVQIKGTWTGKPQLVFQYVLTSGSDPDSVFSQMTYLNGEPLMMTDDGMLPDIIPKVKKIEKAVTMKLPPYSVGFWVVPEAKVKICQLQQHSIPTINMETLTPSATKPAPKTLENIRDINQFLVEKLKNPESESEEVPEVKIEMESSESSEKDVSLPTKENSLARVARRIRREASPMDELNQQLKTIMRETQEFLSAPDDVKAANLKAKLPKASQTMEQRIQGLAEGISDAIKFTNQEQEFNRFLEDAGLKQDFGSLVMNDRRFKTVGGREFQPFFNSRNPDGLLDEFTVKDRLRRSVSAGEDFSAEDFSSSVEEEDETGQQPMKFGKISLALKDGEVKQKNQKQDLIIPHQPDLKGLEEKYKQIVHIKIQDGKRKIDDIKRKIKQEDGEMGGKVKPTDAVSDIQEEIIKKEIELLEKTEETVADILKSQKKRQETFEDIIFDELNDVKGERIRELKEMHKNQRKKENSIVKRQAQAQVPLSRPLLKTVEYIEKNFNLEPESVRKIKRSLEERMGEILRNYDTKKSLEMKKQRSPAVKEERKGSLRKGVKETERRGEQVEGRQRGERYEVKEEVRGGAKERPREKNVIRKAGSTQGSSKGGKKVGEEPPAVRSRKGEEGKRKYVPDDDDSFEMFNEKKLQEPGKKTTRRRIADAQEEKKMLKKGRKEEPVEKESRRERKAEEEEEEPERSKTVKESEEEARSEEVAEPVPLKNDKGRREQHMLKQITLMVDKMNSEESSERSRRMNEMDDISEEFESERRPRKMKRKPRKADLSEDLEKAVERTSEGGGEEASAGEPGAKATAASKLSKLRKLRFRPGRKTKETKKGENEEGGESSQKKRHLLSPLLELDKKKLIKPKLRKLNPKFHSVGNELLTDEKPEAVSRAEEPPKDGTDRLTPGAAVLEQTEELKKDLEKIAEEKVFLERGSEISKDKSGTSGKELSEVTEAAPGETATPTEGFIIVEPTEDTASGETSATEAPQVGVGEGMTGTEAKEEVVEKEMMEKVEEVLEGGAEKVGASAEGEAGKVKATPDEETGRVEAIVEAEPEKVEAHAEVKSEKMEALPEGEAEKVEATPRGGPERKRNDIVSPVAADKDKSLPDDSHSLEDMLRSLDSSLEGGDSHESGEEASKSMSLEESLEEAPAVKAKTEANNSQRKRRATFQPHHEDDDDYSSEERIQKFKQMVYRKSPAKKAVKNEVRPSGSGMGMGADEFLKMAGSTVRVMFDDVIPEAYGQTKNKIQNMGITEYIKEFSKIVEQMKNLDQIFLNIGEAAVKGYIRGNKAEKGPYIQVISRKKREVREEEGSVKPMVGITDTTLKGSEETTEGSWGYATTEADEESAAVGQRADWESPWHAGAAGREPGEGVREDVKTRSAEDTEEAVASGEKVEAEKPPATAQVKEAEQPQEEAKSSRERKADLHTMLSESRLSKKVSVSVPEDLQEKIFTPWIKTTKDFIHQALTTLKRQRELSEILANDLMNREVTKKAIGKREVGEEEEPKLPVYYTVPPKGSKKREAKEEQSSDGLIRRLRGLQPGVYVVPTDEMTNIRSEQITNEAKQKSGMPNVVTLNIYYDKKGADAGKPDSAGQASETKIGEDPVTYYHKAWNAGSYGQGNQYLTVPDVPGISSVPVNPAPTVYATEPRIPELPASRLVQYPPPTYHYPPVQKLYPPIVANPQPVYGPVYYLPQESRYVHPPGTKRQWRDFKARSAGIPVGSAVNTGWSLQYGDPGRNSAKSAASTSYNKNYKFLVQDKKRSVGDFKIDPSWSETALPFWKFFSTAEKKSPKEPESGEKAEAPSAESGSSEDVFAENRKRAKAAVENKVKVESAEQVTEEKAPEEEAEAEKSRKRRSVGKVLGKRSSPYTVEFRDHDILPEWFGTYQEVENALDSFPPHSRRSHIVSTPWSDEDEELLSILEADDELSLVDLDTDDYYYLNDNAIQHSRRYPRSTDQFESNFIKSNMIYKMPVDGVHLKPKDLGMAGVKKLTDEDSSLEFGTKSKPIEPKTTAPEETRPQPSTPTLVQPPTPPQPSLNHSQPALNGTTLLPRNPHDDTFYYFFKYAYDSLVKVMKSMTEFF